MKHWLSILLFLLLAYSLQAQRVNISASKKMSGKSPHFSILGKSNIGVMVYKYGDKKNTIEAYNKSMEVKWSKRLPLPSKDCYVLKVTSYPKELSYFFLQPTPGTDQSILFYKTMNADLSQHIGLTAVDTFNQHPEDASDHLNVQQSTDLSYFLITRKQEKRDNLEEANIMVVQKNGQIIQDHHLDVKQVAAFQYLKWGGVDNKGNAYLAIKRDFKERKQDGRQDYYEIQRFMPGKLTPETIKMRFQKPLFDQPTFKFDHANYRLTAAAFYKSDEDVEPASGYLFWAYDLEKGKTFAEKYNPFDGQMIYKLTGKDTSKHDNVLYTFKIKDYVIRYDGGAIIAAESHFDNTEDYQTSSHVPSASPTFRTVKVHYYNDIIVFAVKPNGNEDWHSMLRKKQISEDDQGYFSSYSLLLTGNKLRFIFNEEIFKKTNINEYSVTPKGEVNRKNLFNAGNENIMLMPKLAEQVSSNQVIIPSYHKNEVSFVKFTY